MYLLIFLAPLFFLPWTVFPVALNKQVLAIFLVAIALICWLLRSISSGKIIYRQSFLNILVFLLLITLAVSIYFSLSRSQSIWGDLVEADSVIALLCYLFVFFLFGAFFRKKQDLVKLTLLFMVSLALLSIFFILQLTGTYIFPWEFTKVISFNPVGTAFGLGIFLAFGLVMLLAMLDILRPPLWMRLSLYILAGLIGAILILLNFWVVWVGLIVAMSLMAVSKIIRKGGQAVRELSLPVVVLAIAALLLIVRLPSFGIVELPLEISPSFSATLDIAKQSAQGLKEVIFGSGPATFAYQYALYRSQALNSTAFWGLRFSQGLAAMPTFLTTLGVIGTGLFLVFFLVFIVQAVRGVKYLQAHPLSFDQAPTSGGARGEVGSRLGLRPAPREISGAGLRPRSNDKGGTRGLISGLFSGYLAGTIFLIAVWFIYPLNFTLGLFTFLGMGMTLSALGRLRPAPYGAGLRSPYSSTKVRLKSDRVEKSDEQAVLDSPDLSRGRSNNKRAAWRRIAMFATPQRSLPLFLLAVLVIVGLLALLYLAGQKYAAAIYYHQGVLAYNRDGNLDRALSKLLRAANLERHQPRFLRTLDEALILRLQNVIGQSALALSEQELAELRVQFQNTLSSSINAAQEAKRLNSVDSLNWINYGRVYESIMFLIEGASDQAILGYQKAIELEPKNPQLPVSLAQVYVVLADRAAQNIIALAQTKPQPGQEQQLQTQIQTQQALRQQFLEKAQEVLEDSLTLKPDYAPNHFLAAQVYERQGKIKEAIYRAENLALIQPLDSGTMFQLGLLYYKDNDTTQAQRAFERAVNLNEVYSNARYFLGLIYDQRGETSKAIEQFERIAELNPDNEEVQKILGNLDSGKPALKGIAPLPEERTTAPLPETGGRKPEIEREAEIK